MIAPCIGVEEFFNSPFEKSLTQASSVFYEASRSTITRQPPAAAYFPRAGYMADENTAPVVGVAAASGDERLFAFHKMRDSCKCCAAPPPFNTSPRTIIDFRPSPLVHSGD